MSRLSLLGVGGPSAFSPDQLSNLMLWVKSDAGVKNSAGNDAADGDKVDTWQDQSGNGRNFTQTTDANRPVFKTSIQNGKPVVRFTRADSTRMINTTNAPQPGSTLTIFLAVNVRATEANSENYFFFSNGQDVGGGGGYFIQVQRVDPTTDRRINTESGAVIADGAYTANTFEIWELIRQASGTIWELIVNGTSQGTSTSDTGIATARATLGARDASSYGAFASADIAEVILYDDVKSSADRTSVRNYLNTRYAAF